MTNSPLVFRRHADVRAVLSDPCFEVPPVAPATDGAQGMAWLRGAVSRFSNGAEHARRRSQVIGLLSAIDVVALREDAFDLASAELASSEASRVSSPGPSESAPSGPTASGPNGPSEPGVVDVVVDVMARLARRVPVGVLATHLGVAPEHREDAVGAVVAMAAAYHPRPDASVSEAEDRADRAVAVLADLLGRPDPERMAAVAASLIQACDATAGLIGNALNLLTRLPRAAIAGRPAEAILMETLRHDPPVRLTRRVAVMDTTAGGVAVPAGTAVVLDLAAANRDFGAFRDPHRFGPDRFGPDRFDADRRDGSEDGVCPHLGFGAGIRPCPGDAAAVALAAGVVDAAAGWMRVNPEIDYEPSPNLRVPARLDLRRPNREKIS
ncbi:cytochrome P450 [Planotetraspora kaengkrachanensis]|uniref:Cytochrome P450 n=1 Tax=Planotetraspora kaengkrachanensis TaxID=575193 RepID=A0A8J3PYR4_9ACTN|nr:cytochrome P450 [Planotetraspora kaengkrachanensis]GIG83513.1 hypothetical protein Pka01_66400 [Planotetraspora kaengkrachanensis]